MKTAAVCVIVVAYNSGACLGRCVAALARQERCSFEAVIFDNASADGAVDQLGPLPPEFRVIRSPRNIGFAGGNNRAAAETQAPWVATLNPDAFPEPDWLARLLAAAERNPDVDMFGSTQLMAAEPGRLDGADQSLRRENEALRTQLAAADAQLANMADSFSRLARQSDSDWGWRLTEIKHLLTAASHRLALERDVDTALAALQMAAARLEEIPDPRLARVRGQLAADLGRLQEAAQGPSLAGLARSLSDLAQEAEALPLKPVRSAVAPSDPAEAEGPETASWWRRALRALRQELRSLVVISHASESAVLLPKEAYFLRQNLRLQLEAARLALLLKDSQQFQTSLRACRDWLRKHFDLGDPDARAALALLEAAAATDLERAVPSVSRSLQALENYLAGRNANAGE